VSDLSDVSVGDELPPLSVRVTRADLVRYAGASGDFNPIHWSDRVAGGVGLPGVIAHGMLTMALAGRVVTEWVGDPGAVFSYGVRFTRPVVVPDDDEGALVELSGSVSEVTTGDDGCRVARVAVTARFEGRTVLSRAVAEVRLPQK
jgi:acyl dehydratase